MVEQVRSAAPVLNILIHRQQFLVQFLACLVDALALSHEVARAPQREGVLLYRKPSVRLHMVVLNLLSTHHVYEAHRNRLLLQSVSVHGAGATTLSAFQSLLVLAVVVWSSLWILLGSSASLLLCRIIEFQKRLGFTANLQRLVHGVHLRLLP